MIEKNKIKIFALFMVLFFPCFLLGSNLNRSSEQTEVEAKKTKEKDQKKEIKAILNEEIVVIGQKPKEAPLSSVTRIESSQIQLRRTFDLAEIIREAPGVSVSLNGKNEFSLRLRGLDSQRLTLLIDGVPIYEPFFAQFDLKSLPAVGLEAIQITTGAASALYGPNVLGGVVNLITRRPTDQLYFRLHASVAELKTSAFNLEAAKLIGRIGSATSVSYQCSDGFYYPENHRRTKRTWSDYGRLNFNFKLMAYLNSTNEFFTSVGIYRSSFGLPPALFLVRPRYWRFRNWDRDFLSLGGLHSFGQKFNLLWRSFLVKYNNSLEQYQSLSSTSPQVVSQYKNDLYGLFLLGDYFSKEKYRLRGSLSWRQETARIQDNINLPFRPFRHKVGSLGFENELSLSPLWKLVSGLSLDELQKTQGSVLLRLNPLGGIIFAPDDYLSLRFSFSLKSRFPTMHSLYASQIGNPDLISETGRAIEAGLIWDRWISFRLTAFTNHFRHLIESVRLADGTRRFRNVSQAKINGLELEIRKEQKWFIFALSGQFLDHQNETESRPLDTLPSRQINFRLSLRPWPSFELSLFTFAASRSFWYDLSSRHLLTIPAYENIDLTLAYRQSFFEAFVRIINLMNKFFYTEPGFPWRSRTLEAGLILNF